MAWLGTNAGRLRPFVEQRITEGEGFKDDVLIDMVMRRIEDAPDRAAFEASIAVLMGGSKANEFTVALCKFAGVSPGTFPASSSDAGPAIPPPTQPLPAHQAELAEGEYDEEYLDYEARTYYGCSYAFGKVTQEQERKRIQEQEEMRASMIREILKDADGDDEKIENLYRRIQANRQKQQRVLARLHAVEPGPAPGVNEMLGVVAGVR